MSEEGDDGRFYKIALILMIVGSFLMVIAFGVDSNSRHYDLEKMGDMICEERGHGDFVEFKSGDEQIVCEPEKQTEKFNGGTIVIEHERGDNYD